MEAWMKRAADFAVGLALSERHSPSVIPYRPRKCELMTEEHRTLPRISPRAAGVSVRKLLGLVEALEGEENAWVHSLMVVQRGSVVLECSAPGYSVNMPHLSHSMSKVITALLAGLAYDEGRLELDTPVFELFPEYTPRDKRFYDIKVRHLLTMSTGVRFSEAGVISECEWTRAFFESEVGFAPGSRFEYNSMNTYILGRIVARAFNTSLTALAEERILLPLRIESFFWEKSYEGFECGGFGVFLSLEGWVKLGMLVRDRGSFGGKQIISQRWIDECTRVHFKTPREEGKYNYGYQVWISEEGNILFSGMLGQAVLISRASDTVIAVNSGSCELFQSGRAFAILDKAIREGLLSDGKEGNALTPLLKLRANNFFAKRRWVVPLEEKRGLLSRLGLGSRRPMPEEWGRILARFDFVENNVGLLPVFVRAMQNNLGNSISDISFVRDGNRIFFVCRDGGREFRLEVGFYDYATSVIDVSGEKYTVKVLGRAEKIYDNTVFKLELILPELPNTRRIEIKEEGEGALSFSFGEIPGEKIVDTFSREILKAGRGGFLIDIAERRLGSGFIGDKLRDTFCRTLIGARVGSPNYETVIEREREKRRESAALRNMLEGFSERCLRDGEGGSEYGIRERLFDVFEKLREKLMGKNNRSSHP